MRYIYPTTISVEDFRLGQSYMSNALSDPSAQVLLDSGFNATQNMFTWGCPEAKIKFYIDEENKVVMEVDCELPYDIIGAFMSHATSLILRSAGYSRELSRLSALTASIEVMADRITGAPKHTLH